ncbi:glycosyltransferase family 4 protein [Billgrantia antri]|uniref:Glycosyltransferase family 4 protein n=1 Tax=Billgrantia antri TaxID=2846777 RepID=A0ABS6ZRC4_9GAMM|nr:glycosyltransferase family 4 protein [Halomonas antri]MBW6391997.1 glycosyltransferase family 4 protein [Halomonas antri]
MVINKSDCRYDLKIINTAHITNAFPTSLAPVKGVFIKEQIDSLYEEGVGVKVHVISKENDGILAYLKAWWFMLLNARRYDLVHCHHVLVGLLGVFSVPRSKLVVSFMNDGRHNLKGRLAPLGWPVFWFLTCYCKWKVYKSRLPRRFAGHGAVLLPNGVNETLFTIQDRQAAKRQLGLDPSKRYVLFVSANTVRAEKRFDLFSEAVAYVQRHDAMVEPLIMTQAARDEVPFYFNAASAHLLASDFEGSPNSVREALACGTPVVARNVGGVRHILDGAENCRVVEEATGAALGEALRQVLDSVAQGEELRARLRQHLIDKGFTQRQVAQQLVALYQKALSRHGSH